MTGYSFDVFISVKRAYPFEDWLETYFKPLFSGFLSEEIAVHFERPASIYYYREALQPGDAWRDELEAAIKTSRCCLALCSPQYFQSEWCFKEFESFRERSQQCRVPLLVPVSIYDGKHFPNFVSPIQNLDLSDYTLTGEAFRSTPEFIEFQKKLRRLAERVGEMAKAAPAFSNWTVSNATPAKKGPDHIARKTL